MSVCLYVSMYACAVRSKAQSGEREGDDRGLKKGGGGKEL